MNARRLWGFGDALTELEYRLLLRNEVTNVIELAPDVPGPGGGR